VLKLYLDTNLLYELFRRLLLNIIYNKPFKLPKTISRLLSSKHELYVSWLTFVEIYKLLKDEFGIRLATYRFLFRVTINLLGINFIEECKLGRNLIFNLSCADFKDSLHLAIAMDKGLTIVTNDKRFFKLAKEFYPKILVASNSNKFKESCKKDKCEGSRGDSK